MAFDEADQMVLCKKKRYIVSIFGNMSPKKKIWLLHTSSGFASSRDFICIFKSVVTLSVSRQIDYLSACTGWPIQLYCEDYHSQFQITDDTTNTHKFVRLLIFYVHTYARITSPSQSAVRRRPVLRHSCLHWWETLVSPCSILILEVPNGPSTFVLQVGGEHSETSYFGLKNPTQKMFCSGAGRYFVLHI